MTIQIAQHILAIGVLFTLAYLPARIVLHNSQKPPTVSEFFVYLFVGWSVISVFSACLLSFNLPFWTTLALPIALLSLNAFSFHINLLKINVSTLNTIPEVCVCLIAVAMPLGASFLMGMGEFPRMFFGTDTPYYLYHAHALTNYETFPPPNLGLYNESVAAGSYHYGTSMMVAFLARLSTLPPHQAMFLYLVPTLLMTTIAGAMILVRSIPNLTNHIPPWVALLVLFFFYPFHEDLIKGLVFDPSWALSRFANVEMFGHGFPMISSQYGFAATLLIFCCILRTDCRSNRLILLSILATLFFFKSAQYVAVGLGIAGWVAISMLLAKDWRPFWLALIALALGIFFQLILYSPADDIIFSPFYHAQFVNLFVIAGLLPFFILAAVISFGSENFSKISVRTLAVFSGFIIGPLIFANLFRLLRIKTPGGMPEEVGDLLQVLAPLPVTASIVTLLLLACVTGTLSVRRRTIITSAFIVLSLPALSHSAYVFGRFLLSQETSHEYVLNTGIAEALRRIQPISEALIVTNSLAYPLVPNPTKLKQLQLPSLFGHQTYAAIFSPLENRAPHAHEHFQKQLIFRRTSWDKSIEETLASQAWTHLLIDKTYPYPSDIPSRLIFNGDRYAVYALSEK